MGNLHDIIHEDVSDSEILSLDDFTSAFDKKTQYAEYFEPKPETKTTEEIPENLIDPDGEGRSDERPSEGLWSPEGEDREPVNPERFARTGKNLARLIDTGFDFTASNFIAKGSGKSYHASESDLNDIAEAWSEIAEEKQWELGPVPRLILLYVIVYGPLTKQAFEDRRILELERRADETEQKQEAMETEIKRLKDELYRKTNDNRADNTAGSTEAPGAKA